MTNPTNEHEAFSREEIAWSILKIQGYELDLLKSGAVRLDKNGSVKVFPSFTKLLDAALAHTPTPEGWISVEKAELDALRLDTERIEWMEKERVKHGYITFEKHGFEWVKLFTISTQWMKQEPTIRSAIDKARTQS